jgi:hypothetical protein
MCEACCVALHKHMTWTGSPMGPTPGCNLQTNCKPEGLHDTQWDHQQQRCIHAAHDCTGHPDQATATRKQRVALTGGGGGMATGGGGAMPSP